MAKFYGKIGYASTSEVEDGIWVEDIVEKQYYGDVLQNFRKLQSGDHINDDINISNRISIIADPYATQNYFSIRYVTFMNAKWKVTDVDASQYPRLILSLGGLYNGQPTESST